MGDEARRRGWNGVLRRKRAARVWVLLLLTTCGVAVSAQQGETPLAAMAKEATPQFEVATIKLADPSEQNRGFQTRGRRIRVVNERLADIVSVAYAVHRSQIVDAPAWFDQERYDIEGVPDQPGYPDMRQMQGMLRTLLEQRFQMKLQREQRELPVYAITVAKGGAKLKKSVGDPSGLPDQTGYRHEGQQTVKFTNCAMHDVVLEMQEFLERPVVDETGLEGRFDFTLTWTPSLAPVSDEAAATSPGLFTAMQEQLGLRLQPKKAMVEVLRVARAERPSAN